jgi:NitT/TauT family transport system substrate-binding protein
VAPATLSRRSVLAGFAAATAALSASGVRAADLQTVSVASALQDDIAPLLYGISSGIFARQGLDVQLQAVNNGAAAAAALLGGTLQMAKSGTMAIIIAHDKGLPLTIVWPCAISTSAAPMCGLVVSRASGISSGKDCNGKTFTGASLQDLNQLAAMAWADANGGDSKTMKFLEITSSATIPALQSGRIDGATVLNPTLQYAIRTPGIKLLANPFDTISKHFCSSTWFTTRDYVEKNADTVKRFLTGLQQATRYEYAHPTEMGKVLAPFLKQDEATLAAFPRTTDGLTLDTADFQPVIELAARYGAIPKSFPAKDVVSAVGV